MSRLEQTFSKVKAEGRGAYIPYVCVGDPDMEFTKRLVLVMAECGADVFELGMPFSDPIADGPTIQGAMARSLAKGTKVRDVIRLIRSLRGEGMDRPIVVMTYLNPILQYGERSFCRDLAEAGGDGLLVVDLPPEESALLDESARENGLDIIRLVAPTTPESRLEMILRGASGYVYAVAVAGVTGSRESVSEGALKLLESVANRTDLPVALGFGISRPEHVRDVMGCGASGVVEGSNLVSLYMSKPSEEALPLIGVHVSRMVMMLPFR